MAILEQAGGGIARIPVKKFDPAEDKITLARNYSRYRKKINENRDSYYMENHPDALDGPGQFVHRKTADGVRLIVWPSKLTEEGLPSIKAPRRGRLVSLRGSAHLVIDGLEVRYSTDHGLGMGGGKAPTGVTIRKCYVHHNVDCGIELRRPTDCTIRRNVIRQNRIGAKMTGGRGCVVEENHIGWNRVDGIVRRVVGLGRDFVEIDPALESPPITAVSIANWGTRTDFRWDLRPAEGSPAIGAGPDGSRNAGQETQPQLAQGGRPAIPRPSD